MIRPLVVALALTLSATGAWADPWDDCAHADPDRSIRGCTQIIERGKRESRKNRAVAYTNRAMAYHDKGEVDRGIAAGSLKLRGRMAGWLPARRRPRRLTEVRRPTYPDGYDIAELGTFKK